MLLNPEPEASQTRKSRKRHIALAGHSHSHRAAVGSTRPPKAGTSPPMGIRRWVAGFLGLSRDDSDHPDSSSSSSAAAAAAELPQDRAAAAAPRGRKGFSVQVPVPVERQGPGPVLTPCPQGDGGVQGFTWYTRRLRIDEDGDVADEFWDEVIPEGSINNNDASPVARFQVKYNTKPATLLLKKQVVTIDGDIRHSLEQEGRSRWAAKTGGCLRLRPIARTHHQCGPGRPIHPPTLPNRQRLLAHDISTEAHAPQSSSPFVGPTPARLEAAHTLGSTLRVRVRSTENPVHAISSSSSSSSSHRPATASLHLPRPGAAFQTCRLAFAGVLAAPALPSPASCSTRPRACLGLLDNGSRTSLLKRSAKLIDWGS
ncbi:hypothetical protein U9M48_025832 [Paspalum notatum var. saurae]|uniref:Uncharacterized protein n=1 Tax=Paspalum notatum var. saurae TaxID=547442 RepID=A0AAQ3TVV0_PASNO